MKKKTKPGAIQQLLSYAGNNKKQLYLSTSYYKVVVFIVPLQGLYAILLEILWIVSFILPLDGLRKAATTVSLYSC